MALTKQQHENFCTHVRQAAHFLSMPGFDTSAEWYQIAVFILNAIIAALNESAAPVAPTLPTDGGTDSGTDTGADGGDGSAPDAQVASPSVTVAVTSQKPNVLPERKRLFTKPGRLQKTK